MTNFTVCCKRREYIIYYVRSTYAGLYMSISERRNNDSGHFQQNGRENNLILRECSNYMENTLQNRERDSMKARD